MGCDAGPDGRRRARAGARRPAFLYGPYKRDGAHTAPSNEVFDASLRSRNPLWGVRDLADVEQEAKINSLTLRTVVEMPANNFSVIFAKT